MSFWKQTQLIDAEGNLADITPYGELNTIQPVRIAGDAFTALNSSYFAVTNTNGGTSTAANGLVTLATNTTANGSTKINTQQTARFVGGTHNRLITRLVFGDSGTVNNTRRWGLLSGATDGIYFKLAGNTISVNSLKGGVETSTTITPTVTLTNLNLYTIEYGSGTYYFLINSVLVATLTATTAPLVNTSQLAAFIDNVNSGGSTTNCTVQATYLTVYRLGRLETQPIYGRITTAATTVLKAGPGLLHRLTINNAAGTLLTVYDNTAGSGNTIAIVNTPAQANPVTLEYDVEFNIGLTVVSTGTWDVTVVYE